MHHPFTGIIGNLIPNLSVKYFEWCAQDIINLSDRITPYPVVAPIQLFLPSSTKFLTFVLGIKVKYFGYLD